jgi:hypothetical protein
VVGPEYMLNIYFLQHWCGVFFLKNLKTQLLEVVLRTKKNIRFITTPDTVKNYKNGYELEKLQATGRCYLHSELKVHINLYDFLLFRCLIVEKSATIHELQVIGDLWNTGRKYFCVESSYKWPESMDLSVFCNNDGITKIQGDDHFLSSEANRLYGFYKVLILVLVNCALCFALIVFITSSLMFLRLKGNSINRALSCV